MLLFLVIGWPSSQHLCNLVRSSVLIHCVSITPQIFTRVLRSFCIPVGASGWGRASSNKTHLYDPVDAATLIVGMMVSSMNFCEYFIDS